MVPWMAHRWAIDGPWQKGRRTIDGPSMGMRWSIDGPWMGCPGIPTRELTNIFEGSANHYDAESNSHPSRNSSQEDEFRAFDRENAFLRRDRFIESMETFHNEINLRLSQRRPFKYRLNS